jgi:hypothetical protein
MKPEVLDNKRKQVNKAAKYKLDRELVALRTGRWTTSPIPIRDGNPQHMYMKLTTNLDLELRNLPDTSNDPENDPNNGMSGVKEVDGVSVPVPIALSAEDAEKIAEAMIDSFSSNRTMRELLESARYFAGAASLGGAIGTRRARTGIKRF